MVKHSTMGFRSIRTNSVLNPNALYTTERQYTPKETEDAEYIGSLTRKDTLSHFDVDLRAISFRNISNSFAPKSNAPSVVGRKASKPTKPKIELFASLINRTPDDVMMMKSSRDVPVYTV